MDSIFVLTKTNFDFFKKPASMERCLAYIGNAPYWQIQGKLCFHHHEHPEYIIHNYIPLRNMDHSQYFHIVNVKKPLYAMSHYTLRELKDMCSQLEIPVGTKETMYNSLKDKISMH